MSQSLRRGPFRRARAGEIGLVPGVVIKTLAASGPQPGAQVASIPFQCRLADVSDIASSRKRTGSSMTMRSARKPRMACQRRQREFAATLELPAARRLAVSMQSAMNRLRMLGDQIANAAPPAFRQLCGLRSGDDRRFGMIVRDTMRGKGTSVRRFRRA